MYYVTKGQRIRAERVHQPSLAGAQMKVGLRRIEGEVERIRGDHPLYPTSVQLVIRQDDGTRVVVDQREVVEVVT